MADLDDFFAKKDKKKSRSGAAAVKKFTASDLLVTSKSTTTCIPSTEAEAPVVSEAAPVAVESTQQPATAVPAAAAPARKTAPPADPDEEEWGEFEQEKERDYSGLKIQKLQIQDYEEEEEEEEEHELNEEGELVKREPAGPWNKITSQTPAQSNTKTVKEPVPSADPPPHTAGGVYIPPSMRNKALGGATSTSSSSSSSRTRTGKKDKGAPDLNNEEFFPTLSAAVAIEQNNIKLKKFEQTERGFTEAKPSRSHSNRMAVGPGEDGPRLNLGNKFNALSSDD